MPELINCGERFIQQQYRMGMKDICKRYGIQEGDAVEVFIKVVGSGVVIHGMTTTSTQPNR